MSFFRQTIYILFGMLFILTACQKIDMDNSKEGSNNSKATSSKTESKGSTDEDDDDEEYDNEEDFDNDNIEDESDAVYKSLTPETLPDGTIYFPTEGHVKILDGDDDTSWILVSLYEWDLYANNTTEIERTTNNYREGDLTGWRIPTKIEAEKMRERYKCSSTMLDFSDELNNLNEKIKSHGGKILRPWEKKSSLPPYRYLCENAYYSFSLKSTSQISGAGAKTLYHLRLVKDTTITKNNE